VSDDVIDPTELPGRVTGYRPQTSAAVTLVNRIKNYERDVAILWAQVNRHDGVDADQRELSLARDHFEDGFMHLVRAVFKPVDPFVEALGG
jgi:hypothetical protein